MHRLASILTLGGLLAAGLRSNAAAQGPSEGTTAVRPGIPAGVVADYVKRRYAVTHERATVRLCTDVPVNVAELRGKLRAAGTPVKGIVERSDCGGKPSEKFSLFPLLDMVQFEGSDSLGTLAVVARLNGFNGQSERGLYRKGNEGWYVYSIAFDLPMESWTPR